ncbi:hypothetical protein M0804_013377 [Polistes exclamans]|nr:hypothetical protein M0804_013377 [Polistes exclamans]
MCKDEIFENYLENEHPNYLHLLLSLPLGVIMLIIRCIFLRFMFKHVGKYFGVKEKLINAQQNEIPGNVYVSESMDYKMIAKLYKLIQWYRIVILQWLKQTRTLEKQHNLRNFNESSWTSFYATCSFTYGFFIFWNMPWLWDIEKCYFDYPFQVVTNDMWWYYTLNMAYYWSKIDINFFSKNTNYFLEFLFHDIVLLVYLHLTWYLNLVRLGIIVIFGMVFGDIIVGGISGGGSSKTLN